MTTKEEMDSIKMAGGKYHIFTLVVVSLFLVSAHLDSGVICHLYRGGQTSIQSSRILSTRL